MAEPSPPFATLADLEARWKPLSASERKRAEQLLIDASDVVITTCRNWKNASSATLRRIVCAIVKRGMPALPADGLKQFSETTGPFTQSMTFTNPAGDLFLTRAELRSLGCGIPGAHEADLTSNRKRMRR